MFTKQTEQLVGTLIGKEVNLVNLLNSHYAYKDFRNARQKMLKNEQNLETEELLKTLTDVFHTTPDYTERVLRQIPRIRKFMQ